MVSQLAEQHVATGQRARPEDFHVRLSSQPVCSFMHAEEPWPSAALQVDAGALWEAIEEGGQEPRHGSECMPKKAKLVKAPEFRPVANKLMMLINK